MKTLTPKVLKNYVKDYDFLINLEQAKKILELLDDYYGTFTSTDIQETTDYIVNGSNSIFAKNFN